MDKSPLLRSSRLRSPDVKSRKASLQILTSVDANFHRMLKILRGIPNHDLTDLHVSRTLQSTMALQSACVVKIIDVQVQFLETNRKSFPDDFLDHNVSTFQFWKDCFAGLKFMDSIVHETKIHRALESFMLFLEFYRSVDSVLSKWPIPTGFSYPRSSADLDHFLDLIPTPPAMAYSLAYRPRLSRLELMSVVQTEYCKVRNYLSSHLERVRQATEVTRFDSEWEPCVRLSQRMDTRLSKLFQPVESKLEEVRWKTNELRSPEFGMDLQAERVYASQQVHDSEFLIRALNEQLQAKTAKYMLEFHLEAKRWLSLIRSKVRSKFQNSCTEAQDSLKSAVLDMMTRWEGALDQAVELNQNAILEIVTNLHQLRNELDNFINSPII